MRIKRTCIRVEVIGRQMANRTRHRIQAGKKELGNDVKSAPNTVKSADSFKSRLSCRMKMNDRIVQREDMEKSEEEGRVKILKHSGTCHGLLGNNWE